MDLAKRVTATIVIRGRALLELGTVAAIGFAAAVLFSRELPKRSLSRKIDARIAQLRKRSGDSESCSG